MAGPKPRPAKRPAQSALGLAAATWKGLFFGPGAKNPQAAAALRARRMAAMSKRKPRKR